MPAGSDTIGFELDWPSPKFICIVGPALPLTSKCTTVALAIALELRVLRETDRITAAIVDTWMVDVTLNALNVAVICVLPVWTALTRPAALTVAVAGVDDDHCAEAVRSAVEPSDKLSIAEHCVVWPTDVNT